MSIEDPVHTNRVRAESFGTVAAAYDRFRPTYPAALVDDLAALAPAAVLDIGCGTGKASVLLAARGLNVLGVEIDQQMADVAGGHGIEVEVSGFEDWDDRGRRFDLVISAQAWHWVDPARGVPKVARVLAPGGTAALFWNYDRLEGPVRAMLDSVYAEHAPELLQSVVHGRSSQAERGHAQWFDDCPDFDTVRTQHYSWQRTFTAGEWTGMARTHSDHLLLAPGRLDALSAAVRAAIDQLGGSFATQYGTFAIYAHRRG